MDFRPSEPLSAAPDAASSSISGADSLSSSSLSFDSQLRGPDMAGANQMISSGQETGALASKLMGGFESAGITAPMATGAEAHALAAPLAPGSDAGLVGALAGGNEPISPIIQMIMKLPGAMSLVNSFFEFLSHFFLSATSVFDVFNPAFLGHAAASFSTQLSHLPMSLSLLPSNASFLGNLTSGMAQPGFASDLLSTKLNVSLGQAPIESLSKEGLFSMRSHLNISGGPDLGKPLFESGSGGLSAGANADGGMLSGPGLTDGAAGSHLAGNTRLFSDKLAGGGSGGFNTMSLATKAPAPTAGTVTMPHAAGSAVGSGTSMGASSDFLASTMNSSPAVGRLSDGVNLGRSSFNNAGFDVGNSGAAAGDAGSGFEVGPSGAVTDKLGNDNLVAMDTQPSSAFRPTIGRPEGQFGQPGEISGLKARQLSLDATGRPAPTADASATTNAASNSAASHSSAASTTSSHSSATHHAAKASHAPKHSSSHATSHARSSAAPRMETASEGHAASVDGVESGSELAMANDANAAYTIQSGDNLWNIAKDHLGDGSRWTEIYEMNKELLGSNPDLIYPGTNIDLPGQIGEIANQGGTTMSTYTVQPGDNLWNISRDHLGSGADWGQIYHANQDIIGSNPSLIHPGQELSIPGTSDPSGGLANSAPAPQVDPSTTSMGTESLNGAGDISVPQTSSIDTGAMGNTLSQASPAASAAPSAVTTPSSAGTGSNYFSQNFSRQPMADASSSMGFSVEDMTPAESFARGQELALSGDPAPAVSAPAAESAAGLQPTLAQAQAPQGIPVLSPNQPVAPGPGAAQAATTQSTGNGAVVSTSLLGDLEGFLKK